MLLKQYYQTGLANNLNGWVWSKFPGYQGTELHILHTYVVPGTVLILVVPTTRNRQLHIVEIPINLNNY